MSEYSENINRLFDEETKKFAEEPPRACDRKTALRLLREFNAATVDFSEKFWPEPAEKYFPAVAEGTMFLSEERHTHAQALRIARERAEALDYEDVAHAFLYGVAHGVPAYRTALPAYLHIKNIPEHGDECLYKNDIRDFCSLCSYSSPSAESKLSFMWANSDQYSRIYMGGYLGMQTLSSSSFLLREFAKMPKVRAEKADLALLLSSLELVRELAPEKKIDAYKELLQKKKPLPLKTKELCTYLDILGYLDILHTEEHRGTTKKFIPCAEMKEAEEHKNDYGYPVRFWRAKNGADMERVHELFRGIADI